MSGAQYLYRRPSGIYFVRLCVPTRFKVAVGKGELHRTTGCRDYRLAKIVAAELAAHWHRAIQALERMDITKVKAGSIKLLGDGYIPLTEAAATLGSTPLALANQLIARKALFFVEARAWLGWPVDDIHEALQQGFDELGQVECVIDENKLGGYQAQVRFDGWLQLRFSDEVITVLRAASPVGICQFLLWPSLDRGFVSDLPGQPIDAQMLEIRKIDAEALRMGLAAQVTPEMLAAASSPPIAFSAHISDLASSNSMKFSEFMAEYLHRHVGFWKADQLRRRKDQCQMFLELMGDLHLARINRAAMRQFSDLIATIPDERHNVRRKYKCPSAGYKELIELAQKHSLPVMTAHAQHRLLDGISEIFNWAVEETMMETSPAKGLGGEVTKRSGIPKTKPHEQRDALSPKDLRNIFSATWYATGSGNKTAKGKFYAYRPHYYWLPLLAVYAGGRLNELSQLYLDDVKSVFEVACLDFNLMGAGKIDIDDPDSDVEVAADKSLKTINANRIVPIHQKILDLGFLEYVEALRASGHVRLFPELAFDTNKGYGKAAGKWFNERFLGIELKIPRNGRKTFHSMRHNFATALGEAKVEVKVKADLMGHARAKSSITEERYDKGIFKELKGHIDKVNYDLPPIAVFNFIDGQLAVTDALKLKTSHKKRRAK